MSAAAEEVAAVVAFRLMFLHNLFIVELKAFERIFFVNY